MYARVARGVNDHLEHVTKLLLKLGLRHVGTAGVDDVDNELTARQQRVVDELTGSDLDRSIGLMVMVMMMMITVRVGRQYGERLKVSMHSANGSEQRRLDAVHGGSAGPTGGYAVAATVENRRLRACQLAAAPECPPPATARVPSAV